MGLDMYFYGKRYIWSFNDQDQKIAGAISTLFPEMAGSKPKQVEMEIKYWRKSNAIHKWFVDNIQKGVDNCEDFPVDPKELRALRTLCEQVLEDKNRAAELLPCASGFFFGSTDYDEYYYEDIEDTLNWLNDFLLKYDVGTLDSWDFYYRASW